jgi:anti-anti-sigma factor
MESPSALLIRLPQRFNHVEARVLSSELESSLTRNQPSLIIDFSNVKQIDGAGLEMLLQYMVKIAKEDGAVQVGDISPEAATILEMTGMDRILELFPRIAEDISTVRVLPAHVSPEKQAEDEVEEQPQAAEEPQPLAA